MSCGSFAKNEIFYYPIFRLQNFKFQIEFRILTRRSGVIGKYQAQLKLYETWLVFTFFFSEMKSKKSFFLSRICKYQLQWMKNWVTKSKYFHFKQLKFVSWSFVVVVVFVGDDSRNFNCFQMKFFRKDFLELSVSGTAREFESVDVCLLKK